MTPKERYISRQYEVVKIEKQVTAKKKEIEDELEVAQKTCSHIDNGGMFYGSCTKCMLIFE